MGRRPIYHTKEEKAAAAAARSASYYKRNAEAIRAARKAKYTPKERLPAIGLTEEEKKLRNRQKAARWFQKNKSRVKQIREAKRSKQFIWRSPCTVRATPDSNDAWRARLAKLSDRATKALNNEGVGEFVDKVAVAYISKGDREALDGASQPFHGILADLAKHEDGVLNTVGAGAHLGEVKQFRMDIQHVIDLLEDLVYVAIEKGTMRRFLKVYENGDFLYHTFYFE